MEPHTAAVEPTTTSRRLKIVDPFPKGPEGSTHQPDLGITQAQFEHFHSDFLYNNSVFEDETVHGHPKPLIDALESVGIAKRCILHDVSWEPFRKNMLEVVESTEDVTQALCLGLGSYPTYLDPEAKKKWVYQYAAFEVICEYIEQFKDMKHLPRIFQDPAFTLSTRYLLEELEGHSVVKLGEAEKLVDGKTFFYAIHLVDKGTCDSVLQEQNDFPALYIGNAINDITAVPGYIAKQIIEQTYLKGDSTPREWMAKLRIRAKDFHFSYEKRYFYEPEREEWAWRCFSDTIVHRRLLEGEVPSTYAVLGSPDPGEYYGAGSGGAGFLGKTDGTPHPSGNADGPADGKLTSEGSKTDDGSPKDGHAEDRDGSGIPETLEKGSAPADSKRTSYIGPLKNPKIRGGGVDHAVAGRVRRSSSIREGLKDGLKDVKNVLKRGMSFGGRKEQKRQISSKDGEAETGGPSGRV